MVILQTSAGVTVGFSQSTFTASEGDDVVMVCAELVAGELETDIFLTVDVLDESINTGILHHGPHIASYTYSVGAM